MPTPHTPEPAYAYMDVEREFLDSGEYTRDNAEALDTLVQFYNVTVGHYLVEMQPRYSYDLWRDDERFRRIILEEVRVMAAELREFFGPRPNRTQVFEAGKAVLRRVRARTSLKAPWIDYEWRCRLHRAHD
jgi:hypothetical protein